MALSDDQRAMLQLLLEGDQSYADIASLLGVSEDEVRSRARAALTEIGGSDPDSEVGLSDYLLGQSDPIGRADAARHLKEDADDHALAEKLTAQLRLIAPGAELPKLPAAPKRARGAAAKRAKPEPEDPAEEDAEAAAPKGPRRTPSLPKIKRPERLRAPKLPSSMSQNQSRVFAALAAGAVILVAVVLAVAGVFESDESTGSEANAEELAGSDTEVPIRLQPAGGIDASGEAVFGILPEGAFYLDLNLREMPELPKGKGYLMWFLLTEQTGFPLLSPIEPDASGTVDERLSLPSEMLPLAERAQFFDIALIDVKEVQQLTRTISQALESGSAVPYPGGSVLRGELTRTPGGGGSGQ